MFSISARGGLFLVDSRERWVVGLLTRTASQDSTSSEECKDPTTTTCAWSVMWFNGEGHSAVAHAKKGVRTAPRHPPPRKQTHGTHRTTHVPDPNSHAPALSPRAGSGGLHHHQRVPDAVWLDVLAVTVKELHFLTIFFKVLRSFDIAASGVCMCVT